MPEPEGPFAAGNERPDEGESTASRLRKDALAGLIIGVVSVPNGLAAGALAGVNPMYGLYAGIAAPIAGSPLLSARLMHIGTTSVAALAVADALAAYSGDEAKGALSVLVVLTGLFLILFGLFRLGTLVRFVSHAVMKGFLTGVAVVLVLDQTAPLVGLTPRGGNELTQFVDLVAHLDEASGAGVFLGVLTFGLAVGLGRTRLAGFSSVVALIVPSVLAMAAGWSQVTLVSDVSPISSGLPRPVLPDPGIVTVDLLLAGLALAVVIAVQGAGVSQSVSNPDGERVNLSRDMVAQGVGNLASGLLSGIAAGGSVGQTALNVSAGARSRWAGVIGGVLLLLFLLLAPGLVSRVPMTVLAALMILAGIRAIDFREARSIWNTGGAARWSIVVTFLATIVVSIPVAVAAGVLLTIVLFLASAASDVRVLALVVQDDGGIVETDPPERLASHQVTALHVYGSLFFAGARTLGESLPDPDGAVEPVVVLRLRGLESAGATLIATLDDYAHALEEVGGRLYLSGVSPQLAEQFRRTRKLEPGDTVQVVQAEDILERSTRDAIEAAERWVRERKAR